MSQIEVLNSATHRALRTGDAVGGRWHGLVEIVLAEIPQAAAAFPLFLAKNGQTGQFVIGMLHGIKAGEAMAEGWTGAFVPAGLKRAAFFAAGDDLAVDVGHLRIADPAGDALFEPDGRPSGTLRDVQQAVATLKTGRQPTDVFIRAMLDLRLIEPVDISLDFDDGERLALEGLYTISLDRLRELADPAVLALFRADHLRPAYGIAGSLPRLSMLAQARNRAIAVGEI